MNTKEPLLPDSYGLNWDLFFIRDVFSNKYPKKVDNSSNKETKLIQSSAIKPKFYYVAKAYLAASVKKNKKLAHPI